VLPSAKKEITCRLLFALIFVACGGCGSGSGGSHNSQPPLLTFTSTPTTAAAEGVPYSYLLSATSSDSSPITFTLTNSPPGATLSGSSVSWTPIHAQSRVSNAFTVTASSASGASANQSWVVIPNGTVNITAATTYWTPSGPIDVLPPWGANPFFIPDALVPQSDGSFLRFPGEVNPDGSISIPGVPGGYYWLQMFDGNYWTGASNFDDGIDLIGRPPATTSQNTTGFVASFSSIQPSANIANIVSLQTDLYSFPVLLSGFVPDNASTFTSGVPIASDIDWTQLSEVYASQFTQISDGNFNGYVLGPAQTISGVTASNGGTNRISVSLSASPSASVPLAIEGTAWASAAQSIGPGTSVPVFSDYALYVQPYATDRYVVPTSGAIGPDFTVIRANVPPSNPLFPPITSYGCFTELGTPGFSAAEVGGPPIVTDQNYGTVAYGDPYPSTWLRMLQYCQLSSVTFPFPTAPGNTTFYLTNKQTTPVPSGPVAPILTSVQSPTLNGNSLFQSATLNTTTVSIAWAPPGTGQPFGCFVHVYRWGTDPDGVPDYVSDALYATAKTSVSVPFLTPGNIYVFVILAASDANANIESTPHRFKIPNAESWIISAPFVIAPAATSESAILSP